MPPCLRRKEQQVFVNAFLWVVPVFVKPKINPPLVPPLGRALLVLSTFVLAALPTVSLVALVVVFVVLPPPLVQVVCLAPSRKLLSEVLRLWLLSVYVRAHHCNNITVFNEH